MAWRIRYLNFGMCKWEKNAFSNDSARVQGKSTQADHLQDKPDFYLYEHKWSFT